MFNSDRWVNSLVCADQYQIQDPNTNFTSDLQGYYPTFLGNAEATVSKLQPRQQNLFIRYGHLFMQTSISSSIRGLGADALNAQSVVHQTTNISPKLPDNQWKIEASTWFATALARIQQDSVRYASKDRQSLLALEDVDQPEDDSMCKSQMIKLPAGYQNFSFLGIMLTVLISVLIILLSFCIDKIIFWCYRNIGFLSKHNYKRLQYIADGQPHLQQIAFEQAGYGEWTDHMETYPTTKKWDQELSNPSQYIPGQLGYKPIALNTAEQSELSPSASSSYERSSLLEAGYRHQTTVYPKG